MKRSDTKPSQGARRATSPRGDEAAPSGDWQRGWRASTQRAKARTEPARTPPAGGVLEVHIDDLDVAAAADEMFRGRADPLLLLAVYAIDDDSIVPVLRGVIRFDIPRAAPCSATPDVRKLKTTTLKFAPRTLVVAALWEEDSGVDARALASALEDPEHLHFINLATPTPEVQTVREASVDERIAHLSPRGILVGARDVARAESDTWVGGAIVVASTAHWRRQQHRVTLQSADRRQAWTLSLSTKRGDPQHR